MFSDILDLLTKKYSRNSNVLGILLFGSAVRGDFDAFSDIDVYILLKKKTRILRENFIWKNKRIEAIFNTNDEAKKYLLREHGRFYRNTSHMLAHGKIIYQRNEQLATLQKSAMKNLLKKTCMTANEQLMYLYSIQDYALKAQRDAKRDDRIAFELDSGRIVTNIIELTLKSHGACSPQAKEMAGLLKTLSPSLHKILEHLFRAVSLKVKIKTLHSLIRYTNRTHGKLPKNWVLPRPK